MTLPSISLDSNWTSETEGAVKQVDSLAMIDLNGLRGTRLRHVFVLHPTDYCVNYLLQFDSLPDDTAIYINGERLTVDSTVSNAIDITAYVALDDNEIVFLVEAGVDGTFAGVRLQPMACD